ncbi:MAG: FkbM family methyltransferase [Rhodospirillales bacterium]|nr:MAG: FkbM family methyltransferase [Rhodospirillales bacterium]
MKRLLLKLLRSLGYDLVPSQGRATMAGVLNQAKRNGLRPATIIDVGAGRGDFTRLAASIFPEAAILMIEPLSEFSAALSKVAATLPQARLVHAVASSKPGSRVLNVHPDLFGSSLLTEGEASDVNGAPREVPAITLDSAVERESLGGPYLIKIDVQGTERDVLNGAAQVLRQASFVILETSMFQFFEQGPLAHEMIAWMAERGFVPYDILGLAHRPLDGALAQADIVFVPAESALRRHHHYATPEQRAALTKRLRA